MKRFTLFIVVASLTACATISLESPSNVDLSGHWVLDSALSQTVIFPIESAGGRGQKGGGKGGGRDGGRGGRGGGERGGQGGPGGDEGGEELSNNGNQAMQRPEAASATQMTIELASDSMGVLYQSGNYRDVDWGVTEIRDRKIVAGWKEDVLVVTVKDRKGTTTEAYQLSENGTLLTLQFTVDGDEYSRVYRRKE